jgi:hypothetical protein
MGERVNERKRERERERERESVTNLTVVNLFAFRSRNFRVRVSE